MTLETARAFLAGAAPDLVVVETEASSATVPLAAAAHGVPTGAIAKSLAIRVGERDVLVVMSGDARLDNAKAKAAFGAKPRMHDAETTLRLTGHPVGGVCPFGLATELPVYLDMSLEAFETVVPAAGSGNSAVHLSPQRLAAITDGIWVDVCRLPAPEGAAHPASSS